jgi:ABC-type antimicrobial peptide transport system permease subunit
MLIGLAGAIMTGRLIAGMLFGISPLDPLSYVSMVGLLGAVAVLACTVPAWRAVRVDPVTSLRTE